MPLVIMRLQVCGNSQDRNGLYALLQISLPVMTVSGCPVGLSLVGPRGSDEALLELAEKLYPLLM